MTKAPNIFADNDKKNIQLQADGSQMSVRYVNEEGKKKALDFIDSKMIESEKWTAFNTYKLTHMTNRSSNRVEGSHSSLKKFVRSSSGIIVFTTEKIDQLYKQR
ncbi:hypothetical protein A0J61_11720, partial [Choanephora cucurbitarum]